MIYPKGTNYQLSKHFHLSEFDCRCKSKDCTITKIDANLIRLLEVLRARIGSSISINSAYRCQEHNTNIGGAKNSQHKEGRAADVTSAKTPKEMRELAKYLFGGVGLYNTFLHLDTRQKPAKW